MMKLSNLILTVMMAPAISAYGGNCRVTFNLDGFSADSAKIMVVNFLNPMELGNESAAVVDGKVTFDIPSDATNLIVASFGGPETGTIGGVRVIAIPDCPMTVNLTGNGYTIGGSPEYVSIERAQEAVGSKGVTIPDSAYCARVRAYIAENPDEVGSAFIACDLGPGILDVDSLIAGQPKKVLHGYYDYFFDKFEAPLIRERNASRSAEGVAAPGFTLRDIDGKMVSLDSLRGKTVLLDFWGSWCIPCLKSIPHLKEIYARYKDKGLEIVSIACNDTDEAWRAAVKRTGMSWISLFNGEGADDAAKAYGIMAFPTMLIISPEGVILKRATGENEEFFNYLESIL